MPFGSIAFSIVSYIGRTWVEVTICFRLKFAKNFDSLCQFDPSSCLGCKYCCCPIFTWMGGFLNGGYLRRLFQENGFCVRVCPHQLSVGAGSRQSASCAQDADKSIGFVYYRDMREEGGGEPNHARWGIRHQASQQGNKTTYSQFFPWANFRPCFWVSRTPQYSRKRKLCGSSA